MAAIDRLKGAFPVVPTPFHDDESMDLDGLDAVVDRLLAAGIEGLTLLGSSAESMYMTEAERVSALGRVARRADGKATLLAGIVQYGTRPAIEEGKRLRDAGADALLVALPQYYPTPLAEVIRHYAAIVREVALPTLYYHYPKPTHLDLSTDQVAKLFAEVDLAGEKNSSVDTQCTLAHVQAIGRPVRMFTGHSFDFLACLRGGAVGSICPAAVVLPRSAAAIARHHQAGESEAAEAAQSRMFRALPLVMPESTPDGPAGVPHSGVKEALVALGILGSARIRGPQPGLSEARRAEVRALAPMITEI